MRLELMLLILTVLVSLSSLFFVPKKYWAQAQFIFLFTQLPTWLLGLVVVELHLIEYPYREFSTVNSTSFIYEYLILPVICVHFNAYFPFKGAKVKKLGFYLIVSLMITILDLAIEKYTALLNYTGWHWYMTFLSVLFILWLSRIVAQWFFAGSDRLIRPV